MIEKELGSSRERFPTTHLPPETRAEILTRLAAFAWLSTAHLKPLQRGPAGLRIATSQLIKEINLASLMPIRGDRWHDERLAELHGAWQRMEEWAPLLIAALPKR